MNIVIKDHQGNILYRTPQFQAIVVPGPDNISITTYDVLDCLFLEDEFWIRDELCALAAQVLNITPNYQADINDARDEFEISQDNEPSVFVYVENNNQQKITITDDNYNEYLGNQRIPNLVNNNNNPNNNITINLPNKPFKG